MRKKIFKKSFDLFGDLIFLLNVPDGIFLDYIGEKKYLALPPKQFLGKRVDEVFPPQESETLLSAMNLAVKSNTLVKVDLSLIIGDSLKHFALTFMLYDEETVVVFARDNTELKNSESVAEMERKNILNILESTEDGLYIIDENHDIVYCNPTIEKDFGKNLGQKCYTYLLGRTIPCEHCFFEQIKKVSSVKRKYYSPITKKIYEVVSTPYYSAKKNLLKLSILRDITEKEKAKKALEESEKKYKKLSRELELILDNIPEPINYKDIHNNFVKVNKYYAKLVGMDKHEIENKNALEIYPKKLVQQYWKIDKQVIEKKRPIIDLEEQWDTKLGKRWVLSSKIPIFDDEGEVSRILGIAKDITERKIAETKLRESEEMFRTIAENSVMGIGIIQKNQVKYINKTVTNILGYSEEEVKTWTLEDMKNVIHPEDQKIILDNLTRKQKGEKNLPVNYRYRIFRKNGSICWIDNYSTPIIYNDHPADLITVIDITENIRAQQELIKLNTLRSELLSRTSHELKTPLSVIKGYAELLKHLESLQSDEEALETLEIIDKGINNLEMLIENILQASRAKAKQFEIEKKTYNLSELIHHSVNEMEGLLNLREHDLTLHIEENITFRFDWKAISQVLRNLISNAIKYTPSHGNIEIHTEKIKNEVIVSVKDNGVGFEREETQFLFTEFGKIERYGKDMDVIPGGSGLGLFISKYIVELHGGKIWMESKGRNKGSMFYFSLPMSSF
ncbi:MAG: putative Histidine kinase [Promethearchaeota archaeon]|nr:MAG: putative Histidine kinase [Candidatus Lokiarchaeota archaeon]